MLHIDFDGPRLIRREELRSAREVFKLCFGSGFDDSMDEAYAPPPRGGWAVMLPASGPLQGRVVSQIGMDHHTLEFEHNSLFIGSIGGVSTHPDFRNLGLAGRLLAHCTAALRQEGARLLLISGDRGLYLRTGNVPAMCFDSFILQSNPALQAALRGNVTVRMLTEADAPACARIHQSDPVHYLRQAEMYRSEFYPGGSWMVELDGKPAGYLLMRIPWEFEDDAQCGVREVNDYAGSRETLVEGIKLLLSGGCEAFNQFNIRELRLDAAWQDTQFTRCLAEMGTRQEPIPLPGHTMRLINFPALRGDLEAYIAGRLPEALTPDLRFEQSGPLLVDPGQAQAGDGQCAIVWQQQRLELATAEMTRLVMGSPQQAPGAGYPGVPSVLGQIISALFPLPSFLPGLNYR